MTKIPADVFSASLKELESGKIWPLDRPENPRNHCHSSERFEHGGFDISFRVDWNDLNENGDPCLDADFFLPGSDELLKHIRSDPAHQTRKEMDPVDCQWIYDFKFGELQLCFLLSLTREATITGRARIIADDGAGE
ncbi:MAG: hypothetical protein WAW75_02165 [Gallionella sp.]